MNVPLALFAYIVFVFVLVLAVGRRLRRNKSRDPFIVCRSCASRNECHVPANLSVCPAVEVEDDVRAVLDGIPRFEDI